MAPPSAPPHARGHALPTIVVLAGIFGPAVNAFITATVLPSVVKEIGGLSLYAWAATAYAVASIVGSAGSSVLMRKLGTRLALIVATLVLVAGTATCGAAPSMTVVVAGRALQGAGGGLTFGIVHAMVRELFPEPMWPSRLALLSSMWGVAAIGGPFFGGVLDLGDPAPETADVVARRIEAALARVPPERLIAAPDCGMKYLPRDRARAKLRALADGARMAG